MRIRFLVSGGIDVGLGHIMRTAVLAGEASRRGHTVAVSVRGDETARAAAQQELPDVEVVPWTTWDEPLDAHRLVVDTLDKITEPLKAAREAQARTIVIDRLDHLDDADATILPVLHGPALPHPRLYQGSPYLLISPVVRALADSPYPANRSIALVTFGGADPLGLTLPATHAMLDLAADVDIHAVIGPSFHDADIVASQLAAWGVTVHRAMPRRALAPLMARARFALTGFGTSLYDLAVVGTPAIYWTHRSRDLADAQRLEARGLGVCGGDGERFAHAAARAMISRTVLDDRWCAQASTRGRGLVGAADGAGNVLNLVTEL